MEHYKPYKGVELKKCNSVRSREYSLKRNYNITLDQYDSLLFNQNGVCAICGKAETVVDKAGKVKQLAVDHCHKTGNIRGLLCFKCNIGLGYFDDNILRLRDAELYLRGELASKDSMKQIDLIDSITLKDWEIYFIEDYCRIYKGKFITLNDVVESIFLVTGIRKIGKAALVKLQFKFPKVFTITRPAAKKGKKRIYYVNIAK